MTDPLENSPDPTEDSGGADFERELDAPPVMTVLGHPDSSTVAVRFGWKHGLQIVSNRRFRFMREDMGLETIDDKNDYLF